MGDPAPGRSGTAVPLLSWTWCPDRPGPARGHPLEAALVVALMRGLGPGELLAFHRDDVDLDVGLLRVRSAIVGPGGRVEIGPTKAPTSRWQLRLPAIAVAALLGHASTRVTSAVYRHRTTPTVEAARGPMYRLFGP